MTDNTTDNQKVVEVEDVNKIEIAFQVESNKSHGEPVFPEGEFNEQEELMSEEIDVELELAEDSKDILADSDEVVEEDECLDLESGSTSESSDGFDDRATAESGEHSDAFPIQEELTLAGKIESIIFASPRPMRAVEIHELLMDQGYTLKEIQDCCDELIEFYRDRAGGFHLKYIKRMGYQFQTTPAAKPLMERQFSSRPRPLSRASLETLAVIAYRSQKNKGVTRAEVEFIRGVDAGSIFKTLVERNLIECVGRKEIPGRPMMFGVTNEFLKIFQLGSINDLPSLESFQTPQDVLDAANNKIEEFEAEQFGVDTEEFIADEEYAAQVQGPDEDFNPLAVAAPVYAPTLERLDEVLEGVEASANDTVVDQELASEEEEIAALEVGSEEVAATENIFEKTADEEESIAEDLIDELQEGQIAWTVASTSTEVHTEIRSFQGEPIEGATAGEVIQSLDAIDEAEWDEETPVVTTVTESIEVAFDSALEATDGDKPSETKLNERNETTEMALPAGDSEPPRSGEVDQ